MILVDTNVWVDNYCGVRPGSAASRQFIDEALSRNAALFYPVHTLKDVFYNLGATFKSMHRQANDELSEEDAQAINQLVWACIENMDELAEAVGADGSDAWLACKYRTLNSDLEDNFVLAAAKRANVSFIVTRDERLLRKSPVPVLSPEDAIGYLKAFA